MKKPSNQDLVRRNESIRAREVLLVRDGQKLGVFSLYDARGKAREMGLDLVEVAPHAKPPVCSIMDYGKYMYERQKHKKRSTMVKEKEVCFRYAIDEHDLETKMNQAKSFLERGDKVRVVVKFKGRENAHKDQGWVIIRKALDMIGDAAAIEQPPKVEGNNITAKIVRNPKIKMKTEELHVEET